MDCQQAVAAILADTARTVACQPSGRIGAWLITTTAVYSDLDLVQIVLEESSDASVDVSDGGLTVMRLDVNGAPWEGGPRRERMMTIARSYGVDVDDDYVIRLRAAPDELAAAVMRVASTAVQIDSMMHDEPTRRARNFSDEVSDWLRRRTSRPLVPNAQLPGTTYTATAMVETRLPVYVQAVGGSTSTDRRRQAVTAGWEYEHAARTSALRPEQAVILLRSGQSDIPSADLDRITEFATLATWEHRIALATHIQNADRENWSTDQRLLFSIQLPM